MGNRSSELLFYANRKDQRDELVAPALELLGRRAQEMDGAEVLRILPDHWSIAALTPALITMVR